MPPPPLPVLLDVDNALTLPAQDTDDAMALALALASPEIDLVGVTACAGNCRTGQSVMNTLRLLEGAGADAIPVAAGRETPFLADAEPHFRYLESKTRGKEARYWGGLGPPPEPLLRPAPIKAHELILQAVAAHPGQITIAAMGSFTNLALALLVEPDAAAGIRQVVHMGGSFTERGFSWSTPDIPDEIWRNTLRFNTAFDPDAAEIVFRSGIALTLVPANVTVKVFQRPGDMDRIEAAATPYHRFLARWGRPWVEWSIRERQLPGAHMHDPLTLAAVIRPAFLTFEAMAVDLDAFRLGKTWLSGGGDGPVVNVATGVAVDPFERFLTDRLSDQPLPRYCAGGQLPTDSPC